MQLRSIFNPAFSVPNLDDLDPDINVLNSDHSCNYFSIDEYKTSLGQISQNFNISLLNLNLRSYHANYNHFDALLDSIDQNFSVIVITETWNTVNNFEFCVLDGYQCINTFRGPGERGGGVSVFGANQYKIEKIHELCLCNSLIESCVAKISYGNL